jgi:hypothetical protein
MLTRAKEIAHLPDGTPSSINLGTELVSLINQLAINPNLEERFTNYSDLALDTTFLANSLWSYQYSEEQPYSHLIHTISQDVRSKKKDDKAGLDTFLDPVLKQLPGIYENIDDLGPKAVTYGHFAKLYACMKTSMVALYSPDLKQYSKALLMYETQYSEMARFAR